MFDRAIPRNAEPEPPPARPPLATSQGAPTVTYTLIAINVLVFLAMILRGVSFGSPSSEDVLAWGADYGPLTLQAGQYWRMLASMFLHFGILHIGMNMYALYQMGPATERFFGHARYFVLYMVTGLGGSLASLVVHPDAVSAGASGAIFGVYGGLMGYMFTHRHAIQPAARKRIVQSAAFFLGINLVYGMSAHIDLTAHAAGLFFGFAAGLVLAPGRQSVTAA